MLGRFLELSLTSPRILESWQWYQRLGFSTATDSGVWSHPYAAVTDGRIALGLHETTLAESSITQEHLIRVHSTPPTCASPAASARAVFALALRALAWRISAHS